MILVLNDNKEQIMTILTNAELENVARTHILVYEEKSYYHVGYNEDWVFYNLFDKKPVYVKDMYSVRFGRELEHQEALNILDSELKNAIIKNDNTSKIILEQLLIGEGEADYLIKFAYEYAPSLFDIDMVLGGLSGPYARAFAEIITQQAINDDDAKYALNYLVNKAYSSPDCVEIYRPVFIHLLNSFDINASEYIHMINNLHKEHLIFMRKCDLLSKFGIFDRGTAFDCIRMAHNADAYEQSANLLLGIFQNDSLQDKLEYSTGIDY